MFKNTYKNLVILILVLVFSALFCGKASAVVVDAASFAGADRFIQEVGTIMNNILTDGELKQFVDILWKAFSIFLLVKLLGMFSLSGVSPEEIFGTIILIVMIRLLIDNYVDITGALWEWSEHFAGGMQKAALGTSDILFVPGFIQDVSKGFMMQDASILDGIRMVLSLVLISLAGILLMVLSFFSSIWALWGYAAAKMIGWMFVPCIMIQRTAFLFDGWFRFFFGFLVYGVMARVSLILVAVSLKSYFNLTSFTMPTDMVYEFSFDFLFDTVGLLAFLFVGILALISTGQFAASIAGGVGGMGSGLRGLAFGVPYLRWLKGG